MKVRYPVECPRCGFTLHIGAPGVRFRGLIWHPECVEEYQEARR